MDRKKIATELVEAAKDLAGAPRGREARGTDVSFFVKVDDVFTFPSRGVGAGQVEVLQDMIEGAIWGQRAKLLAAVKAQLKKDVARDEDFREWMEMHNVEVK